jgi:hypothetical protein
LWIFWWVLILFQTICAFKEEALFTVATRPTAAVSGRGCVVIVLTWVCLGTHRAQSN